MLDRIVTYNLCCCAAGGESPEPPVHLLPPLHPAQAQGSQRHLLDPHRKPNKPDGLTRALIGETHRGSEDPMPRVLG